ncbi:MAG: hypothetical protein AVDCRST_MAG58-235 [uncultured Rubrobacteraceae bacterium]|uniref:Uncharacterized protein n=1 Tax=uncultured Rubrobacteraceae bacterium TaxID=349277 RepID=A0A6J4QQZ6_9ACTN|nr:MAG: hypothetical protein AVDCRST_MAG58-235 [uncultured Rubrobacteraceae bacterium]
MASALLSGLGAGRLLLGPLKGVVCDLFSVPIRRVIIP